MQTLYFTIEGRSLSPPQDATIVCGNGIYRIWLLMDEGWRAAENRKLHVECTQDDGSTEYDLDLDSAVGGASVNLPALPSCKSIRIYAYTDDAGAAVQRTETAFVPCANSIRTLGSDAYSAPYDAYNAMMEYANGKLSGNMTQGQLDTIMAELTAHSAQVGVFPSVAYKRAVAAMSPETRLTGKMTLADSTEIELTNDLLVAGTVTTATTVMRDNYILPGAVPAMELKATIKPGAGIPQSTLNGAELALTFGVRQENGQWGEVPLGVHAVYEIGDDTATGTPITAYDDMKRLDAIPIASAGLAVDTAYSPGQIIEIVAETAGISYDGKRPAAEMGLPYDGDVSVVDFGTAYKCNARMQATPSPVAVALGMSDQWAWNKEIYVPITATDEEIAAMLLEEYGAYINYRGTVVYSEDLPTEDVEVFDAFRILYGGPRYKARAASSNIVTARDLLMHTTASVNALARVDRNRQLRVEPLAKQDATTAIIRNGMLRQRVSRMPYRTFSLTTIVTYPDSEGLMTSEQRTYETMWGDGVRAIMQENPLYTTLDEKSPNALITAMLIELTYALDPVTFTPARVETYGDPSIEPGEWVTLPGQDDAVPATELTWKYRGTQTLDTGGTDAAAGLEQSQAEKTIIGTKIQSMQTAQNEMRELYVRMMRSYEGLGTFRYEEIGHYAYRQIEGRDNA